jgi:CrcB protein
MDRGSPVVVDKRCPPNPTTSEFGTYRNLPLSSYYLLVAVGGALGSMARFWCSGFVARQFGEWFPWGTLIVNVVGSFVIEAFAALSATEGPFLIRPELRVFVMVGLCGGYTTFSSFSLQAFTLWLEGEWLWAGANCVFSFVFCLLAVWLGYVSVAAAFR